MTLDSDILRHLKRIKKEMRPAERRVAEVVLKNPLKVTRMSTAAISVAAKVSEPTISRFCRSIGLSGFPELKIKLAQDIATEEFAGRLELDASDKAQSYTFKVLESAQAGIGRFANQIDYAAVESAVGTMVAAERLFFFGTGASGPVVFDAVYKFLKLKTSVAGHADEWSQRMVAGNLSEKDCIVCISYTGRTVGIVNMARMAKENGARVIAITKAGSPLAEFADVNIAVEAHEDEQLVFPRNSRLVHFCVIEVLASGYTLSLDPAFRERLWKVQESLEDTRLPRIPPAKK